MFKKTKRIFMDYASATPIDDRVQHEINRCSRKFFHNPSALYVEGVVAREIIDDSRKRIARLVQSKSNEIIFTSSGTESINLAIIGTAREVLKQNPTLQDYSKKIKPHIITTNIEHAAVIESCKRLEREGFDVTYLKVDEKGLIKADEVKKHLRPETVLVTIMLANNEIGTILPIRQIGVAIADYKKEIERPHNKFPYLHTDASQAVNYIDVNTDRLNADLLTIDGLKIYGPRGAGCLIVKSKVQIQNILYGGGHEFGLRPGTENLPNIIGLARAIEITKEEIKKEVLRMKKLQKYFIEKLLGDIPEIKVNGDVENRLPNNVNVCLKGISSEFTVIKLDQAGIMCAAMTACKNLAGEESSYVVGALGNGCEKSSLRFTMGRNTTVSDINKTISALKKVKK